MTDQEAPELTCCHHWIIQPAEGPVSVGVCRFCNESREFMNSIDTWHTDQQDKEPAESEIIAA